MKKLVVLTQITIAAIFITAFFGSSSGDVQGLIQDQKSSYPQSLRNEVTTASTVELKSSGLVANDVVLFGDDFSGNLSKWEIITGNWAIENSVLSGTGMGGQIDGYIYGGSTDWINYSLSSDVLLASEADFLFRSTGHFQNEYRVLIWPADGFMYENTYQIFRYKNNVTTSLLGSDRLSIPFLVTSPYHVTIEVVDNNIRLYINGILVSDIIDTDPLSNGRFGLGVIWSTHNHFDNVVVTGLSSGYISGVIKDDLDNPKSGVLVTLSDGQTTTTNSNGTYYFSLSHIGTYTITPSLNGYRFAPKDLTINLSQNIYQDFIVRPAVPEPFLDLPITYPNFPDFTLQERFVIAIQGRNNRTGLVTSWLDHNTPNYTYDYHLLSWNGNLVPDPDDSCIFGWNCYDGHNGVDLQHTLSGDEPIYASAAGTVVDPGNILGYGNHEVLIDHHNGYATFYAHMSDKSVNPGDSVISGQAIGIMGNEGQKDMAIHLHFGLYYDANGDHKWDKYEVVDPFGWNPVFDPGKTDPWGIESFYLWKYANHSVCTVTPQGTTQKSPTGLLTMNIPAGAVSSDVTLNILDVPPVAETSATLRFTGQSFFTQILEWLTVTSSSNSKLSTQTEGTGFVQPVTMTVNYDPDQLKHLNLSNLALYSLDSSGAWVGLPSTIDAINHTVTAQSFDIGNFALQAPLLCEAASQEPNDNYESSSYLAIDGSMTSDSFDIQTDEDWSRFKAVENGKYLIKTANLNSNADTLIEIYDTDGITILASDDNSGGSFSSQIQWEAPINGVYYVRVIPTSTSHIGCDTSYDLGITELNPPSAPPLSSPDDGFLTNDNTPMFTWGTVSNADHYQIQISKVSDFITTEQDIELSPELTTFTSGLLDDGIHYWRVRAIDSSSNAGDWSNIRSFTIDTVPPNPPLLIVPEPGFKVRGIPVTFEWSAWADEERFIFQYDDNSDFSSPIFTSDELITESCTPPFQQLGVTYYWHVKARDEAGNWSDWSSKGNLYIYPTIPGSPTLTLPEYGLFTFDNRPTLAWEEVRDSYKYKVQVSKSKDFTTIIQKATILSPDLEFTTSLLVDGKYFWRVRAINVLGEKGPWSEIWKFTIDTVKPAAPILYKPADGKIVLGIPTYRWLAVIGAQNYRFSYATNSSFTEGVFLSPALTELFYIPVSQDPGKYYWRARAQDKAGNWSKWSVYRIVKIVIE